MEATEESIGTGGLVKHKMSTEEIIEHTDKLKISLGDLVRHKRALKVKLFDSYVKMRNQLRTQSAKSEAESKKPPSIEITDQNKKIAETELEESKPQLSQASKLVKSKS